MRATTCSAICLLAATAASPLAAHVVTIDAGGDVGAYTSLQLDGAVAAVSYYDVGAGDLKVAVCPTDCATPGAAWIVSTVDSAGDVGWYTSMQIDSGRPIVAYYDVGNGALKLATCTAGCATPAPTWVINVVDDSSADTGRFPSLRLHGGQPVIAYRDRTQGDLKLASCAGACATASPTWIRTTIDSAGEVGRFASMQLKDGNPVVAYYDLGNGMVKLATCTAGCATGAPTWSIANVAPTVGDEEMQISLQLRDGDPVVSFFDYSTRTLKLATCTAGCAGATPTWVVSTVDDLAGAGRYSALQLLDGKPVIAYHGALQNCFRIGALMGCTSFEDLRIATCTAACATATPAWVVSTLDGGAALGWDPSMQLAGGKAWASYYDAARGDLKLAIAELAEVSAPTNHTALWWHPDQPGWGINFTHQGDTVFGTLFTHDATGTPMWLVLPAGARTSRETYAGALYRTTGPPFDANPFVPIGPANITAVGNMTVSFAGDSASLAYDVNGIAVRKTIRKQVFGARPAFCTSAGSDRSTLANFQDLWWNPAESGWGLNLTHQGDLMFATLFTYGRDGNGIWLVLPAGRRQADGSFLGDLYRARGAAFNAIPYTPLAPQDVTQVGTMRLRFSSGDRGSLAYTVDGAAVEKAIFRQQFGLPLPACQS